MPLETSRIRHNYLAIVLSAVASFLIEAGWYSYFLQSWLDGIGRSRTWLISSGVNPALQYGTALLAAALLAITLSSVTQRTGAQTAFRGIKVAIGLWLGCVLTTFATESVFEIRSYKLFAINTGFWLISMVAMGAIVGGWKRQGAGTRD